MVDLMINLFHLKLEFLLHWGYELVKNDLLWFIFCSYKNELLSVYWQELLQKAKDRYHNCGGKEKAAKYYIVNNEVFFKKCKNENRNLSEEEKEVKREYLKNIYKK